MYRTLLVLALYAAIVSSSGLKAAKCGTFVVHGQYRKDYYLPMDVYPEYNQPAPLDGGRVHLIATIPSDATFSIFNNVLINGQSALGLPTVSPDFTYFDWARANYIKTTRQVVVSFHSRNVAWFNGQEPLTLTVTSQSGTCFEGTWMPQTYATSITWITPLTDTYPQRWIAHVHNYHTTQSATVSAVLFDGLPVDPKPALPQTLGPQEHVVFTFESGIFKQRGDFFTVQVGLNNGTVVANGARTPEQRFPVEVWSRSSDCAFPRGNASSWNELKSAGIETGLIFNSKVMECSNISIQSLLNGLSVTDGFYAFVTPSSLEGVDPVQRQMFVSAAFMADENDGELDQSLRVTSARAQEVTQDFPSVLTYQGGKTNRHNGAFSGITDIQGLDFYVAGCAPTIIPVTYDLPLQASYAYVKNARNNHMPLPSMTYSQLYGGWNVQPNSNEIILQVGSVLISGAKGVTLFQSLQKVFATSQDWQHVVKPFLQTLKLPQLRHILRTGDIDSVVIKSSDQGDPIRSIQSITQVIRNHDTMLIIALSFEASGYSNFWCHIDISDHWRFQDHVVESLVFGLPTRVNATSIHPKNLKEFKNGQLVSADDVDFTVGTNAMKITNLKISKEVPIRFLMVPYQQI